MHPCWNVPEITQMIFEHVDDTGFHEPPWNALAQANYYRLAVTCRQFTDPALDLLWRDTGENGIIRLLKLLPDGSWDTDEQHHLEIILPLEARDWNRVSYYTSRIRNLTIDTAEDWDPFTPSVLEAMITLPRGSFLPNLQTLFCASSSNLFTYLPMLLGSSLSTLEMSLDGPISRLSALGSIAARFHSLKVVCLYNCPVDESSISTRHLSAFIAQLTRLSSLSIPTLDERGFRHIAYLETLESLTIQSLVERPFPDPHTLLNPQSRALFPRLRKLDLGVSDLGAATNFLAVLKDAPLKTLVILSRCSKTAPYSTALFRALYAGCDSQQLTSLTITVSSADSLASATSDDALKADLLRPLLALRQIQILELTFPSGVIFESDRLVDDMAHAWPNLELLMFEGDSLVGATRYPTLMALLSLSRHCPRLYKLSLPVNATEIRMDHASRAPRVVQTMLQSWDVSYSPLDSPSKVARLLSSVFPRLSIVVSRGSKYAKKWHDVSRLIPELAASREDERSLMVAERSGDE
ncbi:hypothetical protein R3P38DRAFT_797590 [Favolaschia claudopus]|uniref:F-box domain-containing protein n=1 Tax=Favolaschia claudopus TaxID=2862362 RepID=A0AAV9Z2W1_9AGAR